MKRALVREAHRVVLVEPEPGEDMRGYCVQVDAHLARGYRDEPGCAASHLSPRGLLEARGVMAEGERVGTWRFYSGGRLCAIERYEGRRAAAWFYWPDGTLRGAGVTQGTERIGEWRFYDETGQLVQRANYLADGVEVCGVGADEAAHWTGCFVRGYAGELRHGSFRHADGAFTHWDLGAQVDDGDSPAQELAPRLSAVAVCDRPRWLRNLFYVEPERLGDYANLLAQGTPGVPAPSGQILGIARALDVEVARAAYVLSPETARVWLDLLSAGREGLPAALKTAWDAQGPGCLAVVQWLSARAPAQALGVVAVALTHDERAVRRAAARAARELEGGLRVLCDGLGSQRKETRKLCGAQLGGMGDGASEPALAAALEHEAEADVRRVLAGALADVRIANGVLNDVELDQVLSERARDGGTSWPPLHTRGGLRLSPPAAAWFADEVLKRRWDPVMQAVRARVEDEDCGRLLHWIAGRVETSAQVGAHAAAVLGSDAAVDGLGRSVAGLPTPQAKRALDALAIHGGGTATLWLARWASGLAGRNKTVTAHAQGRLEALSLTEEEREDLRAACPDLGGPAGRFLGNGYVLTPTWRGALSLVGPGDAPAPSRVQARYDKIADQVARNRQRTLRQLELAMILSRHWPWRRFVSLFAHRRVLYPALGEILFAGGNALFRLLRGLPVDASGVVVCLEAETEVTVAHPLDLPEEDLARWAHLAPPFDQLHRAMSGDVAAALAKLATREEPLRGSIGVSATFCVGPEGLVVSGADATEKIEQEILLRARA